jgi:hypothetical protein
MRWPIPSLLILTINKGNKMAERKYKYGVRIQCAVNTQDEAKSLKEIFTAPSFKVMLASKGLGHLASIITGERLDVENLSVAEYELLKVRYGDEAVADVKRVVLADSTSSNVDVV